MIVMSALNRKKYLEDSFDWLTRVDRKDKRNRSSIRHGQLLLPFTCSNTNLKYTVNTTLSYSTSVNNTRLL